MFRWLKWTALALAVLLLLAAGGALALRLFLSSEQAKQIVETQGRAFLGRKVSLESLSIGLFRIEAGGLTVAGASAEPAPLLQVAEVRVLLNPAALLYKKVSVLHVSLDGVRVAASRDASGRFSFQDILDRLGHPAPVKASAPAGALALALLAPRPAEAAPGAPPQDTAPKEGEGGSGFRVVIDSLEMRDVRVAFASAAVGGMPAYRTSCAFLSLKAGDIREGAPLDLTAEGSCTEPGLIRFSGGAYADFIRGKYSSWAVAEPFEVSPFLRLAPPSQDVRSLKGMAGGKLSTSYDGGAVAWDASLHVKDFSGEFRPGPQEGWRDFALPAASLRTKGRFDAGAGSGEVERLEVELPYGKARLTEPAKWNAAGEDRLRLAADLSDVAGAARWASGLLALPPPQLTRTGKLSLDLLVSRRRGPDEAFSARAVASFDPLDIAPLAAWAPPVEGFEAQKGVLGGKVEAAWSGERRVRWKLDLRGEEMLFRVRGGKTEPWRPGYIARADVRTEGWADLAQERAEVSRLEIELPFAQARLLEKGGWNLAGRDHLKLRVQVADSGALLRLVRDLAGMRLGDPGQGGKAEATVAFARARAEKRLSVSAQGRLDPMDLALLARLAPLPPAVRRLGGSAGGTFEAAYATGQPLRWKTDLAGQALTAEIRPAEGGSWRRLTLASLGFRSEGWFDPEAEAVEVARLDVRLPFGGLKLGKPARWNVKGRDEAELLLAIDDLSAAEAWVGSLVDLPVKAGKSGETLTASLSAARERSRSREFSFSAQTRFDPLEVSPLVRLWLESSPTLAGAGGEVSGKLGVSYSASRDLRWEADLRGDGVWVIPRAPGKEPGKGEEGKGEEGKVAIGTMTLRSQGGYDLPRGAAEVASLNLELPFGKVQVPRPSVWNREGRDELHLAWEFSDLAPAVRAAGAVAGEPLAGVSLAGTSRGNVSLSRDRRSPASLSATGAAAADVKKVRVADYPNLEAEVRGKADLDGKLARLALDRAVLLNLARPKDPPAVVLESLAGAFSEADLLEGRVASQRVAAKALAVHVYMDPENRSTLDSLLQKRGEPDRPAPPAGGEKAPSPAPKQEPPPPRKAEKKTTAQRPPVPRVEPLPPQKEPETPAPAPAPPGQRPLPLERRVEDLPDIRVGRLEIERLDFHFRHEVEKGRPPAVVDRRNLRVTAENIDTRMALGRLDTRLRLEEAGQPSPFVFDGRTNLGVKPFPATGSLILRKYDLKPLSPYARLARGADLERGELDLHAKFTLRREHLQAEAKGKVYNLDLRPVGKRHILTKAQEVAENLALDLLKRRKGEIPISVRMQGRLDDPRTTLYGMAMDSILVGVFAKVLDLAGATTRGIGGGVVDVLRGVIEGFGIVPPKSPPAPESKAAPPAQAAPAQPEQEPEPQSEPKKKPTLKDLERELKKGLKDFLRR